MKKIILSILILYSSFCSAQNYSGYSAYIGYDTSAHIGLSYQWMQDDYDAYTGFIASVYIFEDNVTVLAGWKLESATKFRAYAGGMVGINTSKGNWIAYEIYGGLAYDWLVSPFIEISYGATTFKTGLTIKL